MVCRIRIARGLCVSVDAPNWQPSAKWARATPDDESVADLAVDVRAGDATPPEADFQEIRWPSDACAQVLVNGAAGSITWDGSMRSTIVATLTGARGQVGTGFGMFLCLVSALALAGRGGVLVHASAAGIPSGALVFLGASGAGKTTTARRLGFEGARRLADDTALVRRTPQGVVVESSPFDRASRLAGRLDREWPLLGAYLVEKGARCVEIGRPVREPLRTWVDASYLPPMPTGPAAELLNTLTLLASAAPPRGLAVPAAGTILPTIGRAHV